MKDPINLRKEFTDKVLSHNYSIGPLLILAGPGTGKTFSLIETIRNQLNKGINLKEFYVTTLTNSAAGDFESEIHEKLSENFDNISTLHYRAKGIVHQYADKIDLKKSFGILNKLEIKLEIKIILSDIQQNMLSQRIKVKNKELNQMLKTYKESIAGDKDITADIFYSYYWKFKKFYNTIDWFDVVYFACKILKENKEILQKESSKQSFILVDEYQDLNPADQDLIKLLSNSSHLLVVGDDDQSIYSGRYADPSGIVNFTKSYPKAIKITLPVCSRCPTAVLKAGYNLINKNNPQKREAKPILVALPDTDKKANNGYVASVGLKSAKAEAEFIGNAIKSIITYNKDDANNIMVLCANKQLGIELINEIKINHPDIPIQDNLSKHKEDEDNDLIIHYLARFLSNHEDNLALRILLALLVKLSPKSFSIIFSLVQKNNNLWETVQLETVIKETKNEREALENFIKNVKDSENKNINERMSAFSQIFPAVTEPIKKYIDEHKKSEETKIDDEARTVPHFSPSGVQFMTMHSAKGLGAKYIFIPLLEKEIKLPAKDIEEQRRLLYVAITRARISVIMTWAYSRQSAIRHKAGGGGYIKRNRSDFISECGIERDTTESEVLENLSIIAKRMQDSVS